MKFPWACANATAFVSASSTLAPFREMHAVPLLPPFASHPDFGKR